MAGFDDSRPIFLQLAEMLEDGVISGAFPEGGQIPSITEYSAALKINPATALKGINLLVDAGLVYKKRGVGMFVAGTAGMLMDMSVGMVMVVVMHVFVRGFLGLAPCKDLAPYLAYISKWMALPAGAQRHGGFTHIFLQSGLSGGGTALPFSSIVTG